jgi:hypothetical protein
VAESACQARRLYSLGAGYGSTTGKKASHMTAELLLAIVQRQKMYRGYSRGEVSWGAYKEALRSARALGRNTKRKQVKEQARKDQPAAR